MYAQGDERRDSGFTIFYMGINLGAMFWRRWTSMAGKIFGVDPGDAAYKVVFISSGIGMLMSLVWFWFGRRQLKGIGLPPRATGPRTCCSPVRRTIGIPVLFYRAC